MLRTRRLETNITSVSYNENSPWPHFRGNSQYSGVSGSPVAQIPFHKTFAYHASDNIVSSPTISSEGNIYFGNNAGNIYAINAAGVDIWVKSFDSQPIYSSATLTNNGTLYIGSDNHFMYALTILEGDLVWSFETGDWVRSSATIGPDGLVIFSSFDMSIYAIDPTTGLQVWKRFTGNSATNINSDDMLSSPVLDETGTTIYVGGLDGYFYALVASTGVIQWREFTSSSERIDTTPAIGNNGTIYVGSNNGYIYRFSPQGSRLYKYPTIIYPRSSCAIGVNGTVYIGTGSKNNSIGAMYAFSADLSVIEWKRDLDGEVYSSPAIDANGNIFFGADNSHFYGLSPSGEILGFFGTLGSIKSSPAISKSGTIYFGGNGNNLWALSSGSNNDNKKALSEAELVVIIIFTLFGFLFCIFCILFTLLWRTTKQNNYERGENNGMFEVLGEMMINGSNASNGTKQRRMNLPFSVDKVFVPQINWYDIKIDQVDNLESLIVGKGSFGTVYKAKLELTDDITKTKYMHDIVVKVMTESVKTIGNSADKDLKLLEIAKFEAAVVIEAESRMVIKESIIKVYGIASGLVPPVLSRALEISGNCSAVGIVMRYEGGGSLQTLLHPVPLFSYKKKKIKNDKNKKGNNGENGAGAGAGTDEYDYDNDAEMNETAAAAADITPLLVLDMSEKLRLLTELAKGIADMHAAGIIHGDLKPDNVLLSSDTPSKIRLADFGLATLRARNTLKQSTLQKTSATRGTPVYCAPEMFVNPYAQVLEDKVAKASRKTDMYAFALIAWEVLTQKKPFGATTKEMLLVAQIYSGARPPVEDIPTNCPRDVVDMIVQTWDIDRLNRRTAIECFNLLQFEYSALSKQGFDVYISYEDSSFQMAKYIFYRLTQTGCVVCLIPVARRKDITDELQRSSVVVALLNQKFQETPGCMAELSDARNSPTLKAVYPVLLEADYEEWSDMQLQYLCQLKSSATEKFDLSSLRQLQHPTVTDEAESYVTEDDGNDFMVYDMTTIAEVDRLLEFIQKTNQSSFSISSHRAKVARGFDNETKAKSSTSTPSAGDCTGLAVCDAMAQSLSRSQSGSRPISPVKDTVHMSGISALSRGSGASSERSGGSRSVTTTTTTDAVTNSKDGETGSARRDSSSLTSPLRRSLPLSSSSAKMVLTSVVSEREPLANIPEDSLNSNNDQSSSHISSSDNENRSLINASSERLSEHIGIGSDVLAYDSIPAVTTPTV